MTIASSSPSLDHRGGGVGPALRFAGVALVGFGLLFPALGTWLGGTLFPRQAQGSLLWRDGVVVGSSLVAQPFASARYFQPRPSAANYDPMAAAGSNWAPSNPALRARIAATGAAIARRDRVQATAIPADLVTASGSGLDPDISPAAAGLQVARVARARGVASARVQALVDAHTQAPTWGVLGQARVNVLELNLALDAETP